VLIILAFILLFLLPSPWSWIGFLVVTLLWFVELLAWNRTVRHRRRVVGAQTLIGKDATVTEPCRPKGQVRLNGEIWEARCDAGANPGDTVRVVGRDDLTLVVEPAGAA
jgi:membrane protein implicated in regulation of membrane protease activity